MNPRHHFFVLIATAVIGLQAYAQQEEPEKPYLDFWRNWLTPQQYAVQLNYVQNQMKDESEVERNFKGRRREVFAAERWVGIGPSHVKRTDPNLSFYGRIRVIHRFYNPIYSRWELYCGASSGGLWYADADSPPPLVNWISLGDNLPNPSVGAFVIKPGDPNTIFVGTGDYNRFNGAGLFKTTNRGLSWTNIPLMSGATPIMPGAISDMFYNPSDTSTMWLSSSGGVFKSTDGGSTWNLNTPGWWGVWDMVINPVDPNIVYVGLTGGNGVWRTTNGGGEWAPKNFGLPNTNVGTSLALDISASNPSILYAAFADSNNNTRGIFKSTNGGGVWNETTFPGVYIDGGQGFHTNVLRIDPTNPDIVYAGSVGFRRTTNGGLSWYAPPAAHGDYQAIEFLSEPLILYVGDDGGIAMFNFMFSDDPVVDNRWYRFLPSSPIQSYGLDYAVSETNVLLSGTQDNGTMYTSDGGQENAEWTLIAGCDGGNEVNIDPNNSSVFFFNSWCGSTHPRLRSLDRGGSVTNINNGLGEVYYTPIRQSKADPDYLFTATADMLYYSTDQGNSWQHATGDSYDFTSFATPRGIAVGGAGSELVCYVWFWGLGYAVQVFEGTPGSMTSNYRNLPGNRVVGQTNIANSGIRVDQWSPLTAYAFEDNFPFRMYKTTNAGVNWNEISGTDAGGILPGARKYDIVSSPANPNVLYAGTDFGVFKTTNNGATWYRFMWGLPIVPVTSLVEIQGTSGDPDTLRIGTFGRGYWQRVLSGDDPLLVLYKPGFSIHGIDINEAHGIGVGSGGRVARTSDGGKTWTEGTSSTSGMLNSSVLIDSLTGFAVGLAGSITRTTDGGGSWATVASPVLSSFFDIAFADSVNGFAVGDSGTIINSTDGGQSWQVIATGVNETLHSIFFTDPLNGWISGTDNSGQVPMVILRYTTDGGMNWLSSQSVGPGGGCDVNFPDPLNGYLTIDGGFMLKTTDGGQSWNQLQTGTQQSLHAVFFANPDDGWACGDGGTFIHTTDGGQTWMMEESGSDSNLYAMALAVDRLFAAGDEGIFSKSTEVSTEVVHSLVAGWNLISVPVMYSDYSTSGIYPSAVSSAFAYQGAYRTVSSLDPGSGYWLKFDADGNIGHTGQPMTSLTVPVQGQWNMIGALSSPLNVAVITSDPPGIVISNYFGYNGSYQIANTLEPGNGYWVKTSQDGVLYLSGASNRSVAEALRTGEVLNLSNRITICDRRGRCQRLYFSTHELAQNIVSRFDLPPVPPEGSFDARFGTQRILELAWSEARDIPVLISSAEYPVQLSWVMKEASAISVLSIDGKEIAVTGTGDTNIERPTSNIRLRLPASSSGQLIPEKFALGQNYPNPFNPLTVISYHLPAGQAGLSANSHVTLKLYNVLGQEVATLVDEIQAAGFKRVEWDAGKFSSGVYYNRIVAGSLTDVKKMAIVK